MKNPKVKLVITHASGDEGYEYERRVREFARLMDVPLIINPRLFGEERGRDEKGNKVYTLWDVYPHSDFVTYPSIYEGFGNAFLEAVYFKKPILVNRYSIYETDIEPRGFDVITMNGYITKEVVDKVQYFLENKSLTKKMVENNFKIGNKFFSFQVLTNKLKSILADFEGVESLV